MGTSLSVTGKVPPLLVLIAASVQSESPQLSHLSIKWHNFHLKPDIKREQLSGFYLFFGYIAIIELK